MQLKLFSKDIEERESAKNAIKAYLKKVLSSSFIFNDKEKIFEILHQPEKMSHQDCKGPLNPSSLQHLREMRHLQLRKQHQGKILHCNGCQKLWNTTEVINSVIQHLVH